MFYSVLYTLLYVSLTIAIRIFVNMENFEKINLIGNFLLDLFIMILFL